MTGPAPEIARLNQEKRAVILAHTYQPGEVQDAADYVGDSYGLSVEATKVAAETIIFCSGDVDPSSRLLRSQPKLRKCPPFILAFHDCC